MSRLCNDPQRSTFKNNPIENVVRKVQPCDLRKTFHMNEYPNGQ